MENNVDEMINKLVENNSDNKEVLSDDEKNYMELEKELRTKSININEYSYYFFKINTACSKGTIKNPLRFYLALKNASVVVRADENGSQFDVYKNLVNTVNYLISEYAKRYISDDNNLDSYNEALQASILQNGYITFEGFKESYYLFELYVLAGIKGNKFFDFVSLLNEVYVKTDKINEIIDLTNMKTRLSDYIQTYNNDYGKKFDFNKKFTK